MDSKPCTENNLNIGENGILELKTDTDESKNICKSKLDEITNCSPPQFNETKKNSLFGNESEYGYASQSSTLNFDVENDNISKANYTNETCCGRFKRFEALICVGLIGFLSMACYDIPGSLEVPIETIFNITTSEFELLYTVYCIPNIFLAYYGGFLIDRVLGLKNASLLVVLIGTLGQVIFTIGGFSRSYWTLLVARFIYGIGGDTIMVICNYYLVMWFSGKEMNFVFGIIFSLVRLGTSFIFFMSSEIYENLAKVQKDPVLVLGSTFSTSMVMLSMILLITLFLAWESKRHGKMINTLEKEDNVTDFCTFGFVNEIRNYSIKYWLASAIFSSINSSVLAFVTCSQQLLMQKYKVSKSSANDLGSAFNLVLSITGPVAGFLVDTVGKKITIIIGSFYLAVLSMLLMAFVNCSPYYPLMLFGFSSGVLFAVSLPLISLVVSPSQLGSAFGLVVSIADLCLSVLNVLCGYLLQRFGYEANCIFYAGLLLVGVVSSTMLWICDFKDGGNLDKWGKTDSFKMAEEK